jgi:hypothetical protein
MQYLLDKANLAPQLVNIELVDIYPSREIDPPAGVYHLSNKAIKVLFPLPLEPTTAMTCSTGI